MHYRDRIFCRGDGCTEFATCNRALTPAVQAAAERWWGGPGAPISTWADPKELTCYEAPPAPFFDATDPTLPIEP